MNLHRAINKPDYSTIGRHPPHILFVNLGLLYLAGEIDIDRFPLREYIQGGGAGLAMTVTRLFGAAERKMYFGADRRRIRGGTYL
jgi:hypothetical protein